MKAVTRLAAAGTAIALLTAAIPAATYLANSVINPAQARCWGIMTDDAKGGLTDVAFLTTFLPTYVEGVPTFVNKDAQQFIMNGETYVTRHKSDLDWITAGEKVNVAYVLEGGRRVVTWIDLEDKELYEEPDLALMGGDNDEGIAGGKFDNAGTRTNDRGDDLLD